jgi:hypothetical protein
MAGLGGAVRTITVNRAPVLTLWAAVVAERLGYDWDEAVTFGRAVAGLNAAAKARRLGIAKPGEKRAVEQRAAPRLGETVEVALCHRIVPAVRTEEGLRASTRGRPTAPAAVHRYLESKFGEALPEARAAMTALAKSFPREELAETAFTLYEAFRPSVPKGVRGWGTPGVLDLSRIRALAAQGRASR